jgi:ABC-2 type transport system permease protein
MTTTEAGASARLSLWRVERLRLLRTGHWIALAIVFVLFGLADPLLTRYLGKLLSGSTGDAYIHITVTAPRASDGMSSYFSNITTLGTLVTVVVAGLAFSIRANPPLATLYLTHFPSRAALLTPRLLTIAGATAIASILGGAAAAYETALLIGAPAAASTVTGIAVSTAGMLFAVAVTFLSASLLRGQVGAIAAALVAVLAVVPLADLIPGIRPIGPNAFTALPVTLQTTAWTAHDTWSTALTLGLATVCVLAGFVRAHRWEL